MIAGPCVRRCIAVSVAFAVTGWLMVGSAARAEGDTAALPLRSSTEAVRPEGREPASLFLRMTEDGETASEPAAAADFGDSEVADADGGDDGEAGAPADEQRLIDGLNGALGDTAAQADSESDSQETISQDAIDRDQSSETAAALLRDGRDFVPRDRGSLRQDGMEEEPRGLQDGIIAADGRYVALPVSEEPESEEAGATPRTASEDDQGATGLPGARPARDPYEEFDDRPYDALGLRLGSFLLFPEVTTETILSDNLFRTKHAAKSDTALAVRPLFRLQSQWSRHELELNAGGTASFHRTYSSEDDRAINAGMRGRLDITRDTWLSGDATYDFAQQGRGSAEFPAGANERPDVETLSAGAAIDQRFNRFGLRLSGRVSERDQSESNGGTGGSSIDTSQDYRDSEVALRAGYEFSPGLAVFAEAGRNWRDYAASDLGGISRDYDGHGVRAGLSAEIAPKLEGEASLGYVVVSPDDNRLEGVSGVVVDGRLTWRPSALTTLALTGSSGIDSTALAGTIGGFRRSIGFDIRHEFRRYLVGLAGISYEHRDFVGTERTEETITANIGAEYLFSREWAAFAGYERIELFSSEPGGDYTENVISLGLRMRR